MYVCINESYIYINKLSLINIYNNIYGIGT